MNQDMGSDPRMSLKMTDRMTRKDCFQFYCGPSVPCFTECCRKLDLALTPYDVLRLYTRLDKSPSEFLEDYTDIKAVSRHGFPEVFLKMDVDEEKLCPFVSKDGCTVYEDRPGACRIYPLGRASSKNRSTDLNEEFYFVVRESHCRGFERTKNWIVDEWLSDQDLGQYNRLNDKLMELYMLGFRRGSAQFSTQQLQMFMMACYNLRKFREFIFRSSFLTKFELSSEDIELIRENDVILLEFSFRWLKFALFGIPALKLRS
ncbi:MAG: YkgJ family cysteine cluster protein [Desulfomonilaceae bacterium]